jgi:hypothetical protein
MTREGTLFPFLRWALLPAGGFEAEIRSGFNLDKECCWLAFITAGLALGAERWPSWPPP